MRLLVVAPDYASHYYPLSAIAGEARRRGAHVTVATGSTLRPRVTADGLEWRQLRMSRGSNAGIARHDDPADDLREFFAATRSGMVATLRHQALGRADDLLWQPESVAREVVELVAGVRPDAIVVDHLAFSTTLALRAAGVPFTTFVPGHPSQLPLGNEVYGYPVAWPRATAVDDVDLGSLRRLCERVRDRFTAGYNAVLGTLSRDAEPVADAFAAHGADVLYNSPAALHPPERDALLPTRHAFLGSCVRRETADPTTLEWLGTVADEPLVYVSFGTFLSARDDVLQRVVTALRGLDARVALSSGSADVDVLGAIPPSWLVRPTLPQVSILSRATAVVTHGGNNTVTEALSAGCPMVVFPFSTDQFAVAADLERTGHGVALDPNAAATTMVADAIASTFDSPMGDEARRSASHLARSPGPEVAADRLIGTLATA